MHTHTHTPNFDDTFTPSPSCWVCVCVAERKRWKKRTWSYTETIKHQKELSIREDYVRYNTDGMATFPSSFHYQKVSSLHGPPSPPLTEPHSDDVNVNSFALSGTQENISQFVFIFSLVYRFSIHTPPPNGWFFYYRRTWCSLQFKEMRF